MILNTFYSIKLLRKKYFSTFNILSPPQIILRGSNVNICHSNFSYHFFRFFRFFYLFQSPIQKFGHGGPPHFLLKLWCSGCLLDPPVSGGAGCCSPVLPGDGILSLGGAGGWSPVSYVTSGFDG